MAVLLLPRESSLSHTQDESLVVILKLKNKKINKNGKVVKTGRFLISLLINLSPNPVNLFIHFASSRKSGIRAFLCNFGHFIHQIYCFQRKTQLYNDDHFDLNEENFMVNSLNILILVKINFCEDSLIWVVLNLCL